MPGFWNGAIVGALVATVATNLFFLLLAQDHTALANHVAQLFGSTGSTGQHGARYGALWTAMR